MPSPFHLLRCALPATAKPARCRGVRSTGAQSARHPCGAAGASGSAVVWDRRIPVRGSFRCASACFVFLREGSSPAGQDPASGLGEGGFARVEPDPLGARSDQTWLRDTVRIGKSRAGTR